jgi:hypothetical protein
MNAGPKRWEEAADLHRGVNSWEDLWVMDSVVLRGALLRKHNRRMGQCSPQRPDNGGHRDTRLTLALPYLAIISHARHVFGRY